MRARRSGLPPLAAHAQVAEMAAAHLDRPYDYRRKRARFREIGPSHSPSARSPPGRRCRTHADSLGSSANSARRPGSSMEEPMKVSAFTAAPRPPSSSGLARFGAAANGRQPRKALRLQDHRHADGDSRRCRKAGNKAAAIKKIARRASSCRAASRSGSTRIVPDARHMAVGPQGVVTFVGTRKSKV